MIHVDGEQTVLEDEGRNSPLDVGERQGDSSGSDGLAVISPCFEFSDIRQLLFSC